GGDGADTYVVAGQAGGHVVIQDSDTPGGNTLDFSAYLKGGVNLNLNAAGADQQVSPGLAVRLSSDTAVANVLGTPFPDHIVGNALNNELLGASLPDDRVTNPAPWNGRTQVVFLDFDSKTDPGEHVYTTDSTDANGTFLPGERTLIQQ